MPRTTETIEIKHWLTGAVLYAAEVPLDIASMFRLRVTVEMAVRDGARLVGASLDGASLDGASLVGASLDGARLDRASLVGARLGLFTIKSCIARATRSDGYEFICWLTDKGVVIKAGCQTKEGTDAYRAHIKANYANRHNGEALTAETLAILDFFDARTKHVTAIAEAA